MLGSLPGLELSAGTQTELWNASNGFPVMMLDILNTLREMSFSKPVGAEAVRAACDSAFPALRDKIDALWTDCPPLLQALAEARSGTRHAGAHGRCEY